MHWLEKRNLKKQYFFAAAAAGLAFFAVTSVSAVSERGNSKNAQKLFEQAQQHFSNYDFEDAKQAYLEALKKDPNIQWAHHQLGRIYFSRNQLEGALDQFNRELEVHEDSVNSLYMRGLTYAFLGDLGRAEEDFRNFVEQKPTSEAGLNDLAYVVFRQNGFREAEQILRELLAKHPSSFLAQQGLAAVLIETDRLEEAERFVAKAFDYAEGMDLAAFQRYYPSLNPKHAPKGLETIQRGIRHNFNITASLQEGEFELDEDTPRILAPYFATAPGGKYGAVFLAASCEAFEHTSGECAPTVSVNATPDPPSSADKVSFSALASDNNSAIAETKIFIDENNDGNFNDNGKTCASSFCSLTTAAPYSYGQVVKYYATAKDTAGNFASTLPADSFTVVDATPPRVEEFHAFSPVHHGDGAVITFKVTDSGGSHLDNIIFRRAEFSFADCNETNTSGCSWITESGYFPPPSSYDIDSLDSAWQGADLSSGVWMYGIVVSDKAGNSATESDPPDVGAKRVIVDTAFPKVEITDPPAGSWQNGDFWVTYEASDAGDFRGMGACKVFTNNDTIGGFPESSWVDRGAIACTDFGSTDTTLIDADVWCSNQGSNSCRVRIWGQDISGHIDTDERSFSIDIGSDEGGDPANDPKVTALSATSPINLGESTTVFWTVTDSGGSHLKHVEIYRAPFNSASCSDADKTGCVWELRSTIAAPPNLDTWSSSAPDSPPGGTWWYGMHVEDTAGNWSTETDPSGTGPGSQKVVVIVNSPPSAINLSVSIGDYCSIPSHLLSWDFSDPEDGTAQTSYNLQADNNSDFSSPAISVSGGSATSYNAIVAVSPGANQLAYNTPYLWRVEVFDSDGAGSGWTAGPDFSTEPHLYPDSDFTFSPSSPSQGEEITFSENATCYDINNNPISCPAAAGNYSWDFDYETPPFTQDAIGQTATTTYNDTASHTVALDVTDADANTCRGTKTVSPKSPLPKFKETAPSG